MIYIIALVLFMPCLLIASNSVVGMFVAMIWGAVLYSSPKFCPSIKKFWLEFYKLNLKIIYKWL